MRNIFYIVNPIAGTRTRKDLITFIEQKTKEQGIPFTIFPSVASGDYSFLYPLIEKQKVTDIVIAGGDGTVSQVIGNLLHCPVDFGIIPCGSGNGLAYAAKISRRPARALDIIFNGTASAIDGFYLNGYFACMLCGLGLDAQVAHDFSRQSRRGLITYIQQGAKNFFRAKPYPFEWSIEGMTYKTDAFFISIANSNQFGNNLTIAPKASLSDGLLDIVIVTKQNKISMLLRALRQISGRNKLQVTPTLDGKKGVIYFQAEQISIINHGKAPLHLDGEPAETPDKVNAVIKKKCFRLIQP